MQLGRKWIIPLVLLLCLLGIRAMPAEPEIDACTLPLDRGSCTDFVHKWYFNRISQKCELFVHGGCGGNANRYDTQEDCLRLCHPPPASVSGDPRCEQSLDIGYCQYYNKLWYFDRETESCTEFIYGGCGGNGNRFITLEQCQEICMLPPLLSPPEKQILANPPTPEPLPDVEQPRFCNLPKDPGPCDDYVHKWHFDSVSGQCRTFVYGGCEGNQNRFDTESECQHFCIGNHYTMQPFILSKYGITKSIPEEDPCDLPADFGGCQDFQRKWYFDRSEKGCIAFLYSGCQGNANRFDTEAACMQKCLPSVQIGTTALPDEMLEETKSKGRCQQPMHHGACEGYVHKWYFNNQTGKCDVFVYGGCGGNLNRFNTELQCWQACVDESATDLPPEPTRSPDRALSTIDPKGLAHQEESPETKKARLEACKMIPYRGSCTDYVHKWYYNMTSGQCETFVFGGCMGNNNRFDSYAECMHFCVGGETYTLPPYIRKKYLEMRSKDRTTVLHTGSNGTVPWDERGEELTFPDTGHEKTFMFARTNAFIQLDGNQIPSFQLRLCREISFEFRTKLPHGLLVYHGIKNRPEQLSPYALYVIVEKGQLKVVHVYGKHSTSVIVGEGLNRDTWHKVTVRIDVHQGRLFAKVNDQSAETHIKGLSLVENYGVTEDLISVVLIGGLSPEEKLHGVKYIIESFVGCIRGVILRAGKAARELLPIKPLVASKHENVKEGCIDLCRTRANLCFVGSRCVNHYNSLTCDCFGTRYEGEQCDVYTATYLTLRGSSYVSYRVYDWRDRVHSSENRISLFFMTHYDDSALFYASGEWAGKPHHIAASILNGSVILDIDFGDGPVVTSLGSRVNLNHWNNLTILHRGPEILVSLNQEHKLLDAPGDHHYLYIDPEIYIGGGPELGKKKGLYSHNNFAGTLKYVFFNDISIIYELKRGNPKVHYIGVLEPEFYESDVEVIPITFPFPNSHIWWENLSKTSLNISFHFKNARSMGVLAYSEVKTTPATTGHGYWVIRTVSEEVRFELVPDTNKNVTHLTSVKFDPRGSWHTVELIYNAGQLILTVDQKTKDAQLFGLQFEMGDRILIGSGEKGQTGLVGCMRLIKINEKNIEPRYVVRTYHAVGDVSLDNCQLVDPCKRPDACEHGGKCSVDVDKVVCDCDGTGYTGKNCHFAEFRKTCEELALLGYNKPDVYLIDIDGNGRFPPAHVKCEFPSAEDSTKTIVEHNLPREVDVRSSSEDDFSFSIKYREFTAEMLQELISHSLYCSQHIKYDCYKAPLDLHSATWFVSSARNKTVDYIGNVKRGTCPCGVNRTCINPQQSCNCDISEAKWHSDEGFFETPQSLGITEMVFLQQKDLASDAMGRITLGPLECVETNTQKYVVTFTTSQSYIEVPGWRKGDIAFSFRTTGEKAILLYQPPIRPNYPSFMVALTSDFHLTFNFTLNTGRSRELEIKSRRKLNGGEWQKIWIDYNEHHVRFMINTDYQMVDLLPEEEFGPFEGSMFIGGATEDLLKKSSVTQGLIGCFRGLVVNGEILDIYSYMSVHLSEIIKDCKPTCDPNPCKNGAMCRELWSKYECVCKNQWAHIGDHCETNINTHALTFLQPKAFLKKNYISNVPDDVKGILQNLARENILINMRTYDKDAMILYMNDHYNNFIHLFIHDNKFVTFLFNDGNEIKKLTVEYPDLGSGKSVQVAVIRKVGTITLHVNDRNATISCGHKPILTYSNRPWINPELEVLAPQRPPAPPTEYYQINLGGYDHLNLRKMTSQHLPGYVGCIRGLKLGEYLIDLEKQLASADIEEGGVIPGCRMKCDEEPCKHQGICTEDFVKGESTCNCELTSYYGEFCNEEKGADFSGESQIQRQFQLPDEVHSVKAQLAFSSSDNRQRKVVLLLLQTENRRSYYLLVGLTAEGHLLVEEDRENSPAYGARISDRNFLDGSRHSVYYQRNGSSAILLIDREEVQLGPVTVLSMSEFPEAVGGTNEVQIGGLNTTDPRFGSYRSYSGCLSNVLVEVNGNEMKPLEEYMLFTKAGSEKIDVRNSAGIRSAQCAEFDTKHRFGPTLNISSLSINLGSDKAWVEDPPTRTAYKSLYSDSSTEEEGAGRVIFIVLSSLFVIIILGALYMLWRADRQYRRRKKMAASSSRLWGASHVSFSEPSVVSYKAVNKNKPVRNGSIDRKPSYENAYVPVPTTLAEPDSEPLPKPNGSVTPQEDTEQKQTENSGFRESEEDLLKLEESPGDGKNDEDKVAQGGYHKPKTKFPPIPEDAAFSKELMQMGFRPGAGEQLRAHLTTPGPVFISQQRSFGNPVSYLGGPKIAPGAPGSSLESLISVD